MDNSTYSEQTETQNKSNIQEIQHDLSQSVNTVKGVFISKSA